jgi:hypothetical protein
MQEAQTHGIQVLLMVMDTPRWANGNQQPRVTPTDPQDYANFVAAAAKRYPAAKRWMIWGEPCKGANYEPITPQPVGAPLTAEQKLQPQGYALLLDDAYAALKAVDPNNIVIGGNSWTVCDIRPLDWIRYLKLPDGRRPRMDLYGHNPFTNFTKKGVPGRNPPNSGFIDFPELPKLERYIAKYLQQGSKPIRVWLSEFTLATGPDTEFDAHYTERLQAQLIKSTFKMARKAHTASYGWIFLQDTPATSPPDDLHSGGLIRANGARKPGYYAFKRAR